jgi:hypothetical protein
MDDAEKLIRARLSGRPNVCVWRGITSFAPYFETDEYIVVGRLRPNGLPCRRSRWLSVNISNGAMYIIRKGHFSMIPFKTENSMKKLMGIVDSIRI